MACAVICGRERRMARLLLLLLCILATGEGRSWLVPRPEMPLLGEGVGESSSQYAELSSEAGGRDLARDLAQSHLRPGQVLELRRFNGHGCVPPEKCRDDQGGSCCKTSDVASIYYVVDAGDGFIGLHEGRTPFKGSPYCSFPFISCCNLQSILSWNFSSSDAVNDVSLANPQESVPRKASLQPLKHMRHGIPSCPAARQKTRGEQVPYLCIRVATVPSSMVHSLAHIQ